MTKKPTLVSAVAAALSRMVKDPAAGVTFLIIAVASLVRTTGSTMLLAVTRLLVTVIAVAPAAKLTVPEGLLMRVKDLKTVPDEQTVILETGRMESGNPATIIIRGFTGDHNGAAYKYHNIKSTILII